MQDKKYYDIEYTDLIPGITFKFKKLNPIEHLNLVTTNNVWEKEHDDYKGLFEKILINVLWTKDGKNWQPLVDTDGNSKLPEFEDNISIGLDLFYIFKNEVLNPVFIESKTYQNIMKRIKGEDNSK